MGDSRDGGGGTVPLLQEHDERSRAGSTLRTGRDNPGATAGATALGRSTRTMQAATLTLLPVRAFVLGIAACSRTWAPLHSVTGDGWWSPTRPDLMRGTVQHAASTERASRRERQEGASVLMWQFGDVAEAVRGVSVFQWEP